MHHINRIKVRGIAACLLKISSFSFYSFPSTFSNSDGSHIQKTITSCSEKNTFQRRKNPVPRETLFSWTYFNTSGMKKEVWKGFHRTIERIFFYEPLKICTYESLTQTINFLKNNLKVNWPLCEASALFLTVNWLSQDQLWSSWDDTAFHPMLTHFRPMFSPCRNQVVGFLLAKCLKNICQRVTF